MDDIKTFSPIVRPAVAGPTGSRPVAIMEPDVDGGWVAYPDYLDLQSQLAAERERADRLQAVVDAADERRPILFFCKTVSLDRLLANPAQYVDSKNIWGNDGTGLYLAAQQNRENEQ